MIATLLMPRFSLPPQPLLLADYTNLGLVYYHDHVEPSGVNLVQSVTITCCIKYNPGLCTVLFRMLEGAEGNSYFFSRGGGGGVGGGGGGDTTFTKN